MVYQLGINLKNITMLVIIGVMLCFGALVQAPVAALTATASPTTGKVSSQTPTSTGKAQNPSPTLTSTKAKATNTVAASNTPKASATFTASATRTASNTSTKTATFTATNTPTATVTASNTATATFTPSNTATATFTASNTATSTFTPSNTPTATWTPTSTWTPSNTPTNTPTATNTRRPATADRGCEPTGTNLVDFDIRNDTGAFINIFTLNPKTGCSEQFKLQINPGATKRMAISPGTRWVVRYAVGDQRRIGPIRRAGNAPQSFTINNP